MIYAIFVITLPISLSYLAFPPLRDPKIHSSATVRPASTPGGEEISTVPPPVSCSLDTLD